MPRRPNTRPTEIYWLVDIRPETLSGGWSGGRPFYCGKTVKGSYLRFSDHKVDATRHPNRRISKELLACANFVRVEVMETVPVDGKWAERERFWIRQLRHVNANAANVSAGGAGVPGLIHSDQAKAKVSAGNKGRKRSAEHRAAISEALRNRICTEAIRANMRAAQKGKIYVPLSVESRAKISAANTGRKHSAESRARMSRAQMGNTHCKGKKRSAESIAKTSAANLGKKRSAEFCLRQSTILTGRKLSAEHIAKMSAARKGKPLSADHRAKLSAAKKGKPFSESHRANLSAARRRVLAAAVAKES